MPSLIYDDDPENPEVKMLLSPHTTPSPLAQVADSPKMPLSQADPFSVPHLLYSSFPGADPISLPSRFLRVKNDLISGHEVAVAESWKRLLAKLRVEIDTIAEAGVNTIPTIDFVELDLPSKVAEFTAELKIKGVAIIRNILSQPKAFQLLKETTEYLQANPHMRGFPARHPQMFDVYWSPGQVKARADPNILKAQRFAMGLWNKNSNPRIPLDVTQPISYADRLRIRTPGDTTLALRNHMDGGSIERWEREGYGRSGIYSKIWEGKWEEYDPWETSKRLSIVSDLYNGASGCSVFRMFQGTLAMTPTGPGEGTLRVCPMLKLATAYVLLRPLFSPRIPFGPGNIDVFLDEKNWVLAPQNDSVIHGALPGYIQEIDSILHPHLQLEKSMVNVPSTRPGDYIIWHPDVIHSVDPVHEGKLDSSVFYIPCCPLTQSNALFLARQRKAFLLGHPGPDFEAGRGEQDHIERPGVMEVSNAGGDEALSAMGLQPFEGIDPLVRMCNAILFPDQFDMI